MLHRDGAQRDVVVNRGANQVRRAVAADYQQIVARRGVECEPSAGPGRSRGDRRRAAQAALVPGLNDRAALRRLILISG